MQEGLSTHRFGKEEYDNDQLKKLVRKALDNEVAEKEKELDRSLTEEEKGKIEVNHEFLERYHKLGFLPSAHTFSQHFGSIHNLASLLQAPTARSRSAEYYYEGDRYKYIRAIKEYAKKHNCTRKELTLAIVSAKVPGVPSSAIEKIDNLYDFLGIEDRQGKHIAINTFEEVDLISVVKKAFEKKCVQEAKKLGKDSLTYEERGKIKLKGTDYDLLREEDWPTKSTLTKRLGKEFGPSWDDVLVKAGLQ